MQECDIRFALGDIRFEPREIGYGRENFSVGVIVG